MANKLFLKWFLLVFLIPLFVFCNKETESEITHTASFSTNNSVSIHDVYIYLQGVKNIPQTKSSSVSIEPVCDRADTLLYIVNYEKGWELLSADKRAPRVISFSESGSFSQEDLASNPAVKAIYDGVMDQVKYLKENPNLEIENASDDWDDLRSITEHESWVLIGTQTTEIELLQDHLTTTRWGQSNNWALKSPSTDSSLSTKCPTGCGPVAAAQLLYYLHYYYNVPEKTYGDCINNKYILPGNNYIVLHEGDVYFPLATYFSYVWDLMPLTLSESSTAFGAVSTLMIQLGILSQAEYSADETSTYLSNIGLALINDFGIYNLYSTIYNPDIIFENVYDETPCIIAINRTVTKSDGSTSLIKHFVLVDACKRNIQRITRRYVWNSLFLGPQFKTEVTDNILSTFFGFNWGWDGDGMMSGGSTIWFNAQIVSWAINDRIYTIVNEILSDFYPL